jgi:hypothetical protein
MKYHAPRGMSDAEDIIDAIGKGIDTAQDGYDFARDVEQRFSSDSGPTEMEIQNYQPATTDPILTSPAAPPQSETNWTPWIVGGAVVVGLFFLTRS